MQPECQIIPRIGKIEWRGSQLNYPQSCENAAELFPDLRTISPRSENKYPRIVNTAGCALLSIGHLSFDIIYIMRIPSVDPVKIDFDSSGYFFQNPRPF